VADPLTALAERTAHDADQDLPLSGAPAALYTSSSGAAIALAAVTSGIAVSALALYEPPYFAGSGAEPVI
jgi:hypothetical protein